MTAPDRTLLGSSRGAARHAEAGRPARLLCAAERHALESIRAWIAVLNADEHCARARRAMARWTHLFTDAGGREASHALDQFLAVLACGTERTIATGCPSCGRPSADELRMLAYLGAVRHRIDPLAEELIAHWLAPGCRAMAETYGRLYGYAMDRHGHTLPPPARGRLRHIAAETLISTSEIRMRGHNT